ncbi:MAG: 50S ribosomal protein L11 methyltransferase [Chloroflexota bacterium]
MDTQANDDAALIEIAVEVDSEAAEAVSELFNRLNGGGYDEDNDAGEAGGGGAVIEATGFDDFYQPIDGEYRLVVKTYLKSGERGAATQRKLEEGLWYLSTIYPIPEPQIRTVREEDWAHAWKKFYKPLRIGQNILLKPAWEEVDVQSTDLVIELEPGMAFGTGMHPTTRLCAMAVEAHMRPGMTFLDVGTGSGILAILAAKLGASQVLGTDIDPIAVSSAHENLRRNHIESCPIFPIEIRQESIPANMSGHFSMVVANILAEVIIKLFDSEYDNIPLAEPISPGGTLILSGILDEKVPMVLEAATRHGLTLIEKKQESDWVALVMQA